MFQLTEKEWVAISSSQIVMMDLPKNRSRRYLPFAFTEHGVTMLASVLKSPKARQMNIAIVRTFIAMRKFIAQSHNMVDQLVEIKVRIKEHDIQLGQIYAAIEKLLDANARQEKWEDRERIGFRK